MKPTDVGFGFFCDCGATPRPTVEDTDHSWARYHATTCDSVLMAARLKNGSMLVEEQWCPHHHQPRSDVTHGCRFCHAQVKA